MPTQLRRYTIADGQMAAALESFDTAIREGGLSHSGDKGLERHIGNARREDLKGWVDERGKALWLIRKERSDSPHKIDAAMAAVLSSTPESSTR